VLQPDLATWGYQPPLHGERVDHGFAYRSNTNDEWFTSAQINELLETGL
jgi:hypothetical protein